MNKALAIFSHPFLANVEGTHDVIIRDKEAPKTVLVPVYDHHDMESDPIGVASVAYTRLCTFNETQNACFVSGFVSTMSELVVGQGLSISAPLLEQVGKYSLLGDIVEVSTVDVPHVPKCRVLAPQDVDSELLALYSLAPAFVEDFKSEMNPQTV